MRFYKEFYGFLFEFNSWVEYFKFLLARLCGFLFAVFVIFLVLMYFANYYE